jgi:putative addiction module component (TIGR02574 family)
MLAEAFWDSIVSEDSEIKLTEPQKNELDRRLAAYEIDQDAGASWLNVKARILSNK